MGGLSVLHVTGGARGERTNGAEAAMFALVASERKAGARIRVASLEWRRVRANAEAMGEPLLRLPWWELSSFLESDPPDIIHVHGTFVATVNLALRRSRTPYLISPHGAMHAIAFARKRVRKEVFWRLLDRRLFRRAIGARALGQQELEAIAARSPGIRIDIVPNELLAGTALITAGEREAGRAHLGLAANEVCVLYLGRLATYHKGLDYLVPAFEALPVDRPARLVLAGPRVAETVPQSIQTRDPRIRLVGTAFGQDKRRLLAAADLFIHSSRHEGMPTACLEALGSGLRLMATPICGLSPFIETHDAGWSIALDRAGITAALQDAVGGGPRVQSPRIAAAAREEFAPERVAAQMLGFYERLLTGRTA